MLEKGIEGLIQKLEQRGARGRSADHAEGELLAGPAGHGGIG